MEVITNRDIVYSEARGEKRAARKARREERQKGYGDGMTEKEWRKSMKEQRKSRKGMSKEEKKASRLAARTQRKARRKARKDARKLRMDKDQDGRITYRDFLPRVRKKVNTQTGQATWVKTKPDGSEEEVDPNNVRQSEGATNANEGLYDQTDVGNAEGTTTDSQGNPTANYREENTEEAEFEDGTVGRVPSGVGTEDGGWAGLSKGAKIGIIAGGAAVAIVATILIVRAVRKKKGK